MFEVTGVDLNAGNLSFEDPALPGFPKGGWQGGRNWRTGGAAPGGGIAGDSTVAPLIVDNVKEELDAGGEYYYDEHYGGEHYYDDGEYDEDGDLVSRAEARRVAEELILQKQLVKDLQAQIGRLTAELSSKCEREGALVIHVSPELW